MKQNQRRAFRVTSSLQYRFLAISISYSFIIVCFFAIAVFVPDMVEMRDQSLNPVIRGVAASRVLSKNVWVWPAILSLIIILGLHSFFMFKKIIGPLFRFRCVFGELGGGNLLSRFKLRKKDYLHTEEEALNNMIKILRERLESVKHRTDDAFKSLGELEQTATKGSEWTNSQIDLLHAHRKELEKLKEVVHYFRTDGDEPKTSGTGEEFQKDV